MAGKKFLAGIDLVKTQIQNALLHVIAGDASSPSDGQVWYNSSTFKFRGRANGANVTFVNGGGDLATGSVAIAALAVDPRDRTTHSGSQAASTISDLAAVVKAYRIDEFAVPTTSFNVNSQRIINVATPTAGTDAANKNYVDGLAAGQSWKQAARVRVSTNIANLSAPGATLDGVTMAANDRVLLTAQTTASQNGLWVWNGAAAAMTRPTDYDSGPETLGTALMIQEGTSAGQQWIQTTDGTITLGTTSLAFTQFGGGTAYSAGNGLTESSGTFNVGPGNGILVTADTVTIDPAKVVQKYAGLIGTGALTTIAVTHSLGTQDITWSLRDATSNEFVECDGTATDTNTLTLVFAVAPTSNQYRVVVHG